MMTTLETLRRLCEADGVSGDEGAASKAAAELLAAYTSDVKIDDFGSVIANIPAEDPNAPLLLLDAHIDQIGMIVTHITDEGFVRVDRCGGIDRRLLLAQAVVIHGTKPITGIVGTLPPHLTSGEDTKKVVEMDEVAIDTGYSKEELLRWVAPGDRVTYVSDFTELQNGRVTSRSLDDRAGVASILNALERLKGKPMGFSLAVVFSCQEETGGFGAASTSFRVKPDAAIAVDVSFAHTADADERKCGKMGEGAMIGISPILNRGMYDELVSIARTRRILWQPEVMGGRTGTNADEITVTAGGIRTALLSIPLKYMHTPVEVVQVSDVEAVGDLIAQYVLNCGE